MKWLTILTVLLVGCNCSSTPLTPLTSEQRQADMYICWVVCDGHIKNFNMSQDPYTYTCECELGTAREIGPMIDWKKLVEELEHDI